VGSIIPLKINFIMMKKRISFITLLYLIAVTGIAQIANIQVPELEKKHFRNTIRIPDLDGYKTLKCDFHMHTVFSDGIVWPDVRIEEAWEEGLDAIAITDHIEYTPHKPFVGGSFNSSYEIAYQKAKELGIVLIRGAEITRDMPPGHLNVLFVKNIDKINVPDPMGAIMEAKNQGAFIFWNHPCWTAQQPDSCIMFSMHKDLIKKHVISGIEVFNEKEWYPIALHWCLENNLTILGNSDIHDFTSHYYSMEQWHRPMTLVFSKDTASESIREALFAGRTVAWFAKYVAGKEVYLQELFRKSVIVDKPGKTIKGETALTLKNMSDFTFELSSLSVPGKSVVFHPGESISMKVKPDEEFFVTNWFIGADKNLRVRFF